jgi:hypothetical protein
MAEIVVHNSQYRQCVGVEKIKKLLECCPRITSLDSTRAAGSGGDRVRWFSETHGFLINTIKKNSSEIFF